MNPNVSSPYVLLDFVDDRGRCRRLFFSDPAEVIVAARPEEVLSALGKVQRAVREGHWVAGLVSYEAASGLDPALTVRGGHQLPLVWFGVFDRPPSAPDRSGVVGGPLHWEWPLVEDCAHDGFANAPKPALRRGRGPGVNSDRVRSQGGPVPERGGSVGKGGSGVLPGSVFIERRFPGPEKAKAPDPPRLGALSIRREGE